jgi:uncharacterized protein YgiB involved in biofilm formation
VHDKPLTEAWREAKGYVRKQPAMGFGGAMLAGFMLARFLNSSAPDESQSQGASDGFGASSDARTIGFGDVAGRYSNQPQCGNPRTRSDPGREPT